MAQTAKKIKVDQKIEVYLEIGKKRVFAGAIDWPGWCRSGRDEASALQALSDYAGRYAEVIAPSHELTLPSDRSEFAVIERLEGDATTDFGAPGKIPSSDFNPLKDDELSRLLGVLKSCWRSFDAAVKKAEGKELRKGPRGGGRDVEGIIQHVLGGDLGYLGSLGYKMSKYEGKQLDEALKHTRQAIEEGLEAARRGEIPATGPRGGTRWPARYFVRRAAWHVLDHTWEIEDRN